MDDLRTTRRRGAALEEAILEAAWLDLADLGWASFSIGSVARRAGTAKAVLYRRWANRVELAQDMLSRAVLADEDVVASSGDLHDDLLAFLRSMTHFLRGPFGEAVRGTLVEPVASRRGSLAEPHVPAQVTALVTAAVERGDLAAPPPPLVQNLGPALVVHELVHTGEPPADDLVWSIVDEVWLPALLAARRPDRAAGRDA